ncbi:hypothetical protein LOK49_Contig170G00003 [Camellia lanceoleosa]|nr:hypothetical protein LOK49_Contig170G00003 [Camellia lanceoleosa]
MIGYGFSKEVVECSAQTISSLSWLGFDDCGGPCRRRLGRKYLKIMRRLLRLLPNKSKAAQNLRKGSSTKRKTQNFTNSFEEVIGSSGGGDNGGWKSRCGRGEDDSSSSLPDTTSSSSCSDSSVTKDGDIHQSANRGRYKRLRPQVLYRLAIIDDPIAVVEKALKATTSRSSATMVAEKEEREICVKDMKPQING